MVSEMISSSHGITAWLSGRTQKKSSVDGICADPVPVSPRGSMLGPIRFLIFINDLPDNINSTVRLFADACVSFIEILEGQKTNTSGLLE